MVYTFLLKPYFLFKINKTITTSDCQFKKTVSSLNKFYVISKK